MKHLFIAVTIALSSIACAAQQKPIADPKFASKMTECNSDTHGAEANLAKEYHRLQEKHDAAGDQQTQWEYSSRQIDLILRAHELNNLGQFDMKRFACFIRS